MISTKPIVPVVFSTDHNFIKPTAVAIKSMLVMSTDVVCSIHILHSPDVSEDDMNGIKLIVADYDASVTFISMNDAAAGGFEVRGISIASYYRLFIPWLLPQYDKVLYIDGDVVFKESILSLWNLELENNYFGGISAFAAFIGNKGFIQYCSSIGIIPSQYINAGILSINSALLRQDNMKERLVSRVTEKLLYQDQDIINLECKGRIKLLPTRFNAQAPSAIYPAYLNGEGPAIVHYPGSKPWKTFTYHWRDWWDVYALTPFYDPQDEVIISREIMSKKNDIKHIIHLMIKRITGR